MKHGGFLDIDIDKGSCVVEKDSNWSISDSSVTKIDWSIGLINCFLIRYKDVIGITGEFNSRCDFTSCGCNCTSKCGRRYSIEGVTVEVYIPIAMIGIVPIRCT